MLIDYLANKWSAGNTETEVNTCKPNVIVPLSFGTRRDKESLGSKLALLHAIGLQRNKPEACIAFGNPENCFEGSGAVEESFRLGLLKHHSVPMERVLHGEGLVNSITEADAIKKLLQRAEVPANTILLISTRIHSRAVRYIWERTFPHAKIVIFCMNGFPDVEPDHQILLQRNRYVWFLANIARQVVMSVVGLERASRVTHFTAKQ